MDANRTDTAHHTWDAIWQTEHGRERWMKPESNVLDCATRLRLAGAERALDLGCGVGRHALALAALGFETTAFDASEAGLSFVENAATKRGLELSTQHGTMTDLPFRSGEFDYVLSFNVIYHGDPDVVRQSIAEIARVLKPGGTFQGTMLSKRRHDFGLGKEVAPDTFVREDAEGDKSHPHYFCDAATVVQLFAGFEPLSLTDIGADGTWHWHLIAERF